MKVAILSESEADEAAIRVLVEGALGRPVELVSKPSLRARGWPSVRQLVPKVIAHLQYRTDADGLVVVADANNSAPHLPGHEEPGGQEPKCRLCLLKGEVARTVGELRPVAGRSLLRTAVGLACPAIEAWYLCGREVGVTERAWEEAMQGKGTPFNRNWLKLKVYGTDRPGIVKCTRRGVEEARRLADVLDELERAFPKGFGSLRDDLRGW